MALDSVEESCKRASTRDNIVLDSRNMFSNNMAVPLSDTVLL